MLVDEYQDTNRAQYRWLQLLAEEHRNLCVVGDDDQSIYGFRGADIRNILDFEDDFPDADVVKLEQNYRSTQTILDAANAVIANNRARKDKTLWTRPRRGRPGARARARGRARRGPLRGVARSSGSWTRAARATTSRSSTGPTPSRGCSRTRCVRYGVAYQVIGGTRFYERAEIKDALAYLTLLVNPSDTVAFGRIVNSPRRGHRPDLAGAARSGTPTRSASRSGTSPPQPEAVPGLGAAAVKAVGRFMSVMERLRERVEGGAGVGDLLHETLEETGYTEALQAERTIEAQGRLENLEELVGVAREYDADGRGAVGRGVPAADRALLRAGQPARRARASSR